MCHLQGRIRLKWSNLWDILGGLFRWDRPYSPSLFPFPLPTVSQVCCHSNPHVGLFALDSLRQLATWLLEKEELPHLKFQKDILRSFEYTMMHTLSLLSRSCPSLDPLHPLRLHISFSPVKLSTFLHHPASIPCLPKGLMPTPASPSHLLVACLSLTPPVSSYRICFSYAIPVLPSRIS